jgi:uncharacterized protein YndB with AHSA1/START domain
VDERKDSGTKRAKYDTKAERKSDREFVVTRSFNGPAPLVFDAWTKAELFQRWWTPKSFGMTILSCNLDARTGGTYRLLIAHPSSAEPMAFFGRYIEVTPYSRLVWTNDEGAEGGAVTTVTFEEKDGGTFITMSDLYPSKKALDDAIASQSTSGTGEQFEQLDELLITERASG